MITERILQHSVEISINNKNQWSGKVKVYGETPSKAMQECLKRAEELNKLIRKKNEQKA